MKVYSLLVSLNARGTLKYAGDVGPRWSGCMVNVVGKEEEEAGTEKGRQAGSLSERAILTFYSAQGKSRYYGAGEYDT